ncbi:MAG TPA: YwiC-like family protein [Aridibacter sp.]|nr:YwiC-like family protein [Aridibacter sp.]
MAGVIELGREVLTDQTKRPAISLKRVALPTEHGSWVILLEPLVASLVVYPSAAAPFIALTVIGAFLLRQPLKVLLLSFGRKQPRGSREAAAKYASGYTILFVIGVVGAIMKTSLNNLAPLALLVPLGAFQLYNDTERKTRELVPELAGATGISAAAASVVLAGGGGWAAALALWVLFASRAVASFVYVRQRLRLEKGKAYAEVPPAVLHFAALFVCGELWFVSLLPLLPVLVVAILLARCIYGLSERRKRLKAVQIGIREVLYGAALTAAFVAGSYLEI